MDFETRAIHAGQEPDPATGAIITPIYQTSTYVQDAVGEHKGYDYSRVANPTRTALETCLASLEGAEHGLAFSSGLGATTTVMHLVDPGQRVVMVDDVYGGVYRMLARSTSRRATSSTRAPDGVDRAAHIDERTRLVWIETPDEPAPEHRRHPRGRRGRAPRGRDRSRSTTPSRPRTCSGRSSSAPISSSTRPRSTSAATPTSSAASSPRTTRRCASGSASCRSRSAPCPGPFDCWLVLRGIKTLAAPDASATARTRTRSPAFLDGHPAVERVLYPGLASHPGHELAARQMRDFGGMVSFLASSEEEAVALVARTKIFQLAESLGGVESLIEHPYRMTHGSTVAGPSAPPRELVRLSVGIESADDLIADLETALVRSAARA